MSRMTTEEAIAHAWMNLREREYKRTGEELPKKCPDSFRMILEAADEIAKRRAMEEMAARKKIYRRSKKR